ncbi:MAG: thiamine pyrophosphate-dependent enzyme [Dehalobacterium sp.]
MNYIKFLEGQEDILSPGLSSCPGCASELATRTALKIIGKNTIMTIPPGCMAGAGCVGFGFKHGSCIPAQISLLDNPASLAAGIKAMYERKGRDDVHVVVIAGDGASADCGFQSLSGAAERGDNIIYICYDNEGYMNTGFQRSSTTPLGASTTTTPSGSSGRGKEQSKKNLSMIMAMHNCAYTATLSPAYMPDFVNKIQKAMTIKKGMSYLHIFAPCPTGWKTRPDMSIELARKAVQTNFFPLFEVEDGKYKITKEVKNPLPVREYIKLIGRMKHLNEEEISNIQKTVDKQYNLLKLLAQA